MHVCRSGIWLASAPGVSQLPSPRENGTQWIIIGAPASDFDRMVWGGRIAGIFFLADDHVDNGGQYNRIPGYKKAATGTGVSQTSGFLL